MVNKYARAAGFMAGMLVAVIPLRIGTEQKIIADNAETSRETPVGCLIQAETPEDIEEEMQYDSLELLAICVEAEAGNQPLEGRRMVVDVILNRVDDPDFPDTIEGVITQPYHFSSYWDGGMDKVSEPSETTYTAIEMELEKRGWPGLFYFTAGNYSEYGTPWKQVGDHYFSTK